MKSTVQNEEIYEEPSKGLEILSKQIRDITLKFITFKYGTF